MKRGPASDLPPLRWELPPAWLSRVPAHLLAVPPRVRGRKDSMMASAQSARLCRWPTAYRLPPTAYRLPPTAYRAWWLRSEVDYLRPLSGDPYAE
jgi:hypothetical protein